MPLAPRLLLVPSRAAAAELPRRVAARERRALAGLFPLTLLDLARLIAEPRLLGRGLRPWDHGRLALIAREWLLAGGARALGLDPDLPIGPVAAALGRTLRELRLAGASTRALAELPADPGIGGVDAARRHAVAEAFRHALTRIEGRIADPATVLAAATEALLGRDAQATAWLDGARCAWIAGPDLWPLERDLLVALARHLPVERWDPPLPPGLRAGAPEVRGATRGEPSADFVGFAALAAGERPAGLARLASHLFEPGPGEPAFDGLTFITAPGEAAEARAIARRLLAAAGDGFGFEDMAVLLPRAEGATLYAETLRRARIPCRLHPSLPLATGPTARALLLLLRCRGLGRAEVLEFLGFCRAPFGRWLAPGHDALPSRWEAVSRDARIVSGLDRFRAGLRGLAEDARRAGRAARADDALDLLVVVEALARTLAEFEAGAPWATWSQRLRSALEDWVGPDADREAVQDVIADLGGLGSGPASLDEVETALVARFEWERMPLVAPREGAVHVGVFDALAGVPFRLVCIPGLVEGGFPAPIRPDPFLLDAERTMLGAPSQAASAPPPSRRASVAGGQLSLFEAPAAPTVALLPTVADRLRGLRRAFHAAASQATERLVLSYPRADPRTGKERLPSLFYVAALSAALGRPAGGADLENQVAEDDPAMLPPEQALDAGERDLWRMRQGGEAAADQIAAGSPSFRLSRLASVARFQSSLTAWDGRLDPLTPAIQERIDPISRVLSASRLHDYAGCGFQYLLKHVLKLEPALAPEERTALDPLERGTAFHAVAEQLLREWRDAGAFPLQDDAATRARAEEIARAELAKIVAQSPPRFTALWERECALFLDLVRQFVKREAQSQAAPGAPRPAHFELAFGRVHDAEPGEPHRAEPLTIPLPSGATLRLSGQIDRVDRNADGSYVVRDYKTGRAPKDEGAVFRGGRQLQIPLYIRALGEILPGAKVEKAFLDYVNGGRPVAIRPEVANSDELLRLLDEVVGLMRRGVFPQEASACVWCDFTTVCGPQPLVAQRLRIKERDAELRRYVRLRDFR
ncbi:MAG: PD-(D/E)XK nuclease family protein [Vicinamibacteria bacterium]|nr:PD-(D/E)XK nuclease family protein [Vicinamibacteria bacterium]